MTSNHALQRVKRMFKAKKAGHTGSLDPIATGMLPLCFGEATKFSQFLLTSDKTYQVVAKLGQETTTGDSEGSVTTIKAIDGVTEEQIKSVCQQFIGEIQQIPPMFSAVKLNGKPLYALARKGIEVERQPRPTTIYSLDFIVFQQDELVFSVHCSKGTYIRTLVEDIGRVLGCGAHVIGLRRTGVSSYGHAAMHKLSELEKVLAEQGQLGLISLLLPVETSVETYPAVQLTTSATFYLRMGQAVRARLPINSPLVRLMAPDDRFIGVGEVLTDGRVKPFRLVSQ